MRILICGDRDWTNYQMIFEYIQKQKEIYEPLTVIEGEADGVDIMSRKAAEYLGITVKPFPANWRLFKGQAGSVRNAQMIREGKPDKAVAFHNDIEHSKGTKDMVNKLEAAGIEYELFKED